MLLCSFFSFCISVMDLVVWKGVIKEFLPHCCHKFAADIRTCVKAVEAELKPSYMFDLAFVPSGKIIAWLKQLQDVHLVHCRLSVIAVEEQIFVVNCSAIKQRMKEIAYGNEDVVIIDVSSDLKHPKSISAALYHVIVRDTAQVINKKLTAWNTDDVFILELTPDINRTTVFGLLLGYPVVYWYSDVTEANNCLSHVPLWLFRILAVDNTADSHTTVIYSFTVPEQLYSHCQVLIDNWQQKLFSLSSKPCIASDYSLHVDSKIVVQPEVCM